MVKTTFVIVTYNAANYIRRAIQSIIQFEYSSDIVIVDNNSRDGTVDILSDYPDIEIISLSENLGFGKGNNIGISIAIKNQSDYIYLLNQDAFLLEPVTPTLIDILNQDPLIGIVSPFQYDTDGLLLERNFEKFMYQQSVLRLLLSECRTNSVSSYYKVDFVQAASWFMPSHVLKHVGGFDPLFFHFGEDNNYLNRLKYHGYKVAVVPSLKVAHETNLQKLVKRHYDRYFINRLRSSKLSKYTDISNDFHNMEYLSDQFREIYGIVLSIILLRWSGIMWRIIHVIQMCTLYSRVKTSRAIAKNVQGAYLNYRD